MNTNKGLKIPLTQVNVGSIPTSGTIAHSKALRNQDFLFDCFDVMFVTLV